MLWVNTVAAILQRSWDTEGCYMFYAPLYMESRSKTPRSRTSCCLGPGGSHISLPLQSVKHKSQSGNKDTWVWDPFVSSPLGEAQTPKCDIHIFHWVQTPRSGACSPSRASWFLLECHHTHLNDVRFLWQQQCTGCSYNQEMLPMLSFPLSPFLSLKIKHLHTSGWPRKHTK